MNVSEDSGWEELKNGVNGITILGQGTLLLPNVYNSSAGQYVCSAKTVNPTTKREVSILQVCVIRNFERAVHYLMLHLFRSFSGKIDENDGANTRILETVLS